MLLRALNSFLINILKIDLTIQIKSQKGLLKVSKSRKLNKSFCPNCQY